MSEQPMETRGGPMLAMEPVRASVTVDANKERAFEVFSAQMSSWWPRTHKIGGSELQGVILEPRAGGRWSERDADGSECEWGRVLAYERPDLLILSWQIDSRWAFDPELLTEVEVRFTAEGPDRTRVDVEHRQLENFGDAAEAMRKTFESDQGWPLILARFGSVAGG
jgi:uncharacterized protein YndB with AHSA1/START domain